MSPRPGGESDKFGNRYEGAWTVRHLLYVLRGAGTSVTVEAPDEIGDGVEFTYRQGDTIEVHQVKRQNGNANSWPVNTLIKRKIFDNARTHIDAGRQFHFVSTVPARPLQEMADRARRSEDPHAFVDKWLTAELKSDFDALVASPALGSVEVAWNVLRGFWVEWPDERDIVKVNATLAELLLSGAAGNLAAAGLGDLILQNLGMSLDVQKIASELPHYGLARKDLIGSPALVDRVAAATTGWVDNIERELLQPKIARTEVDELMQALNASERVIWLVGAAGGGKSAVLYEAMLNLQEDQVVLAFRLDRLDPFSTTTELGNRVGFDVSPVTALAAAAGDTSAVLVIDQLDAVSLVSGRMPRNFDAIANLVREAAAFPNIRILIACRKFDMENDHRIRDLAQQTRSTQIEVGHLTEEQIAAAVQQMGLDANALAPQQMDLLRAPLNLVLLNGIASDAEALSFRTTKSLFDAFWRRKVLECTERRPGTRFNKVVSTLADAISARQRLSVPESVLDERELTVDAGVLVSEHILNRDVDQIAFFHESFFDYAFARGWLNRGQTLVEFLVDGEQELFRRAQVRQVLNHLREQDPHRFIAEVGDLLSSTDVRFHIKDVVLRIMAALQDPTSAEWGLVCELLESDYRFRERLWGALQSPPWFNRLDDEGVIADWLASPSEELNGRALTLMRSAGANSSSRIAELLAPYVDKPKFGEWLRWIMLFVDLNSSRELFDLLLLVVKAGQYDQVADDISHAINELAKHQPEWAVEFIAAYLVDRPGAKVMNEQGKLVVLSGRDRNLLEAVQLSATGAPEKFCARFLGYMIAVMAVAENPAIDGRPITDRHFSFRQPLSTPHELGDALMLGARAALRSLAANDLNKTTPVLEYLAQDPHDAAQWLLYEALQVVGEELGEWAAVLLLEGPYRFLCGYSENGSWTARQLLAAITPYVSEETLRKLEYSVIGVRFPWESRPGGYIEFNLLSAFDSSRLSEAGRRRLGELQRLFGMDEPEALQGVRGGFIGSPISQESAKKMSDVQWMRAIAKHAENRTNWANFTGGAEQLSQVLKAEAVANPLRYARLALKFDSKMNPAYATAVLMAFADAEEQEDAEPIFDAVRHIMSLGMEDTDRWLGHSLRRYIRDGVPDDLFALVLDRALEAKSPTDDTPVVRSEREGRSAEDLYITGINVARGDAAQTLGDMLIYDVDGRRTSIVAPLLNRMASDTSMAVRSCVAHVIAACLRHARPQAVEAFGHLVQSGDLLLATPPLESLIIYVGNSDPSAVIPTIKRMLASSNPEACEVGGRLAAFAGLEWAQKDTFALAVASSKLVVRKGVAGVCANRLPYTSDAALAGSVLERFFADDAADVRNAAAEVAGALRGERLRSFRQVLLSLIDSAAFSDALPQLAITLEAASDRVDDLVLRCATRFVAIHGSESADIRGRAAADSREIGELLLRAYVQAGNVNTRRAVLDLVDELLLVGAYGVAELVGAAER